MKRSLCTRNTRSSTKNIKRETHRQTSEMHVAITNRNLKAVKSLVKKGEKLCTADGLNCFIIALHAYENSTTFIRALLELEPEGANAKNTDGYTLLMHFAHDYEMVKYLIQLGADVSAQSPYWSPLTKAIDSGWADEKIVKALLSAGADMQTKDQNGCTVLCHVFKNLHLDNQLLLFRNHPAFIKKESFSFSCPPEMQPQCILLNRLGCNLPFLFELIMSNFRDVNALYDVEFWINEKINKLTATLPMNCICHILNNSMIPLSRGLALVEEMTALDFSISNPYGFSPLTVLMSRGYRASDIWFIRYINYLRSTLVNINWSFVNSDTFIQETTVNLRAAQSFVAKGVHIQQRCLVYQNRIIQDFKNELSVPDALWLATISGKFLLVDFLISSCVCPPLALLLTIPRICGEQLDIWFPHLAKYGPVPLGTRAYTELLTLITTHGSDNVKEEFNRMHGGQPSLLEMCRYRIRLSLGEAACQVGNNMDSLISTFDIPSTLQEYLRKNT